MTVARVQGIGIVHLSLGGPDRRIVDATGKAWTFEMHPHCGPVVLNERGDPVANQPGSRSPFWFAIGRWIKGGSKVGADGLCQWAPPEPLVTRHVAGRHHVYVSGELPE